MAEKTFVLDIGRGDVNADWIKYLDGGTAGKKDQLASVNAMIAYYEVEGGSEEEIAVEKDKRAELEAEIAEVETRNAKENRESRRRRKDRSAPPTSAKERPEGGKQKRASPNGKPE